MRVGSSLLWLRLAWHPKKAKVCCLLVTLTYWIPSETTLVSNIVKIRSVLSNIWFHDAIVFMGRVSINTAEVSPL